MQQLRRLVERRWVRQLVKVLGSILVVGVLFVYVAIPWVLRVDWPDWTGFNVYIKPSDTVEREKTLWDWMSLLIVPLVLAVGGFMFNRTEKQLEHQRAEERAALERQRADEQTVRERQATEDNQHEVALQAYLDQMTVLLLDKKLRESQPHDEVRTIALIRTLTAIRRLDYKRRNILIRFLRDANLVGSGENHIIDFKRVDLRGICLGKADLWGINFADANFQDANLEEADLRKANFREAILEGAFLKRADLSETKLKGAFLGKANLERANLGLVDFGGAFLDKANLEGAFLFGAKLEGADLTEAILKGTFLKKTFLKFADLAFADLSAAKLEEANLEGANLRYAILLEAIVTEEQLATCRYLNGATLPNGIQVPDDVDNPFK